MYASFIKNTFKVRLKKAQTLTYPTRTRTRRRLLSSFNIQIEHELEGENPWTVFEAAHHFLAVIDKIWSFKLMGLVEPD